MSTEEVLAGVISALPQGSVFVEVGVLRATTLVYIAEECKNTKAVLGVDSYQPYIDELGIPYSVGAELALMNRKIAEQKVAESMCSSKMQFIIQDAIDAAKSFEDHSIDCVFLDAYMNRQQVVEHVLAWFPKVKYDGILCGHDIYSEEVQCALQEIGLCYEVVQQQIWLHQNARALVPGTPKT